MPIYLVRKFPTEKFVFSFFPFFKCCLLNFPSSFFPRVWENECVRVGVSSAYTLLPQFLFSYSFLFFSFPAWEKRPTRVSSSSFCRKEGIHIPPPFLSGNNKNALFPRELCSSSSSISIQKKRVGEIEV